MDRIIFLLKKYKIKMKYLVHKMPGGKKIAAQESLQNSDLTINVWIKRTCCPNTGRLGGKGKVSDLIGWPSFRTNLKTKVITGITFSPFFLVLGTFLLEIPGVHYVQKTRAPRLRQFFANSKRGTQLSRCSGGGGRGGLNANKPKQKTGPNSSSPFLQNCW